MFAFPFASESNRHRYLTLAATLLACKHRISIPALLRCLWLQLPVADPRDGTSCGCLQLSWGLCNPPGAPRTQLVFPLPPSSVIPVSFCRHSAFTLGRWCNKETLPQNLQEQFVKWNIHKGIQRYSTRSTILIHWKPNLLPSSNKTRTDVLCA